MASLQSVNCMTQLGVTCRIPGGALSFIVHVNNKDVQQCKFQYQHLRVTTIIWVLMKLDKAKSKVPHLCHTCVRAFTSTNTVWMKNGLGAALRRTWCWWMWNLAWVGNGWCLQPRNPTCPGLNEKQQGQQGKGGDSISLLCSAETSPGVLCIALSLPIKEGCGPVRKSPEEVHNHDQRAGTPLWWRQVELRVVQPGKEKVP